MEHHRYHKKEGEIEKIEKVERKIERKVEKKLMENKGLIVAIVVVFVLVIAVGGYVLFSGEEEGPAVSEQVSALVTTCDEWCDEERLSSWCDFELSATPTVSGTCSAFSKSTIYAEYGVQGCPAIDCDNRPASQTEFTCAELGGVWEAPVEGTCEPLGDASRFILSPTESPPTSGQICCTPAKYLE